MVDFLEETFALSLRSPLTSPKMGAVQTVIQGKNEGQTDTCTSTEQNNRVRQDA
jgi:hypothetical protein